MDTQVAERLLREAKLILPQTDTKKVNYITDCEYGEGALHTHGEILELRKCVEREEKAIRQFLTVLHIQSRYDTAEEIIDEFYDMTKVVFDDCCSKGYVECGEAVLKCMADGMLDRCGSFEKEDFLKEGVKSLLEICGKSQIITRQEKYRRKALNIIVKARQKYFGELDLKPEELFGSYNNVEIGSYYIRRKLSEKDFNEYQGY